MQDFYRCDKGMMPTVMQVASKACYKLVVDMLYEARIQAVIDYKARIEKVRIYKRPARDIRLTREQYLWVNTQSFLNQLGKSIHNPPNY